MYEKALTWAAGPLPWPLSARLCLVGIVSLALVALVAYLVQGAAPFLRGEIYQFQGATLIQGDDDRFVQSVWVSVAVVNTGPPSIANGWDLTARHRNGSQILAEIDNYDPPLKPGGGRENMRTTYSVGAKPIGTGEAASIPQRWVFRGAAFDDLVLPSVCMTFKDSYRRKHHARLASHLIPKG